MDRIRSEEGLVVVGVAMRFLSKGKRLDYWRIQQPTGNWIILEMGGSSNIQYHKGSCPSSKRHPVNVGKLQLAPCRCQ